MSRARTRVPRRHQSTSARSYGSIHPHKGRRARGGVLSVLRQRKGSVVLLAIPVVSSLVFILSLTVRDWALGALGYGLIPVALWIMCFSLAVRYKTIWIKRFWRVWLGSALLVAISLGILSIFHASSGPMEGASLGGYWGQFLGGSPPALGALKVAVLILLSPILLFPRRTAPIYRRVAGKALQRSAITSRWLVTHTASSVRTLAKRRTFGQRKEGEGDGNVRRAPSPSRSSWKSMFGAASPTPSPTAIELPEPPMSRLRGSQDRREKAMEKTHGWQLPSLELLSKGEDRPMPPAVLQGMAQHIEETLAEHRVDVAVEDIRTGPRVPSGLVWCRAGPRSIGRPGKGSPELSREPAVEISRVKVQSILMREKDLALALKTPYLRLEAPVPGESLVGLEMPNPHPRTVVLRSVAESPPFQKIAAKGGMPVALGEDTGGEPVVADLGELPPLAHCGGYRQRQERLR